MLGSPRLAHLSRIAIPSVLILVAASFGAGCGGDETQAAGPGGRGGPGGPPRPPTPVAVERIEVGSASSYYTATATLEAEHRAEVLSRTTGAVRQLLREEGDRVQKGEALLVIEDAEQRYRVQQANANLLNAQSEHDRRAAMRDGGLLSNEEFETTANTLSVREAELGLAEVALSYTRVVAPFAGRVVRRHADLGANVSPGSPLFEVIDDEPLLARVFIPAKRMGFIEVGQTMKIRIDSNGTDLLGIVRLISPIVDATTGTVKVTAEITDYPVGTRPGDFAQVKIVTAKHDDAVLVPSLAIFEEQGQSVLYVAVDGAAVKRTVETGFVDDDRTEILSGIEPGELVVVKGQRQLRDEAPLEILEGPPDVLAAQPAAPEETAAEGAGGGKKNRPGGGKGH